MSKNWNCDNDKCKCATSEVRVYPLGGGGNLILCEACFAYENSYRRLRAAETKEPANWPQVPWDSATQYPG